MGPKTSLKKFILIQQFLVIKWQKISSGGFDYIEGMFVNLELFPIKR